MVDNDDTDVLASDPTLGPPDSDDATETPAAAPDADDLGSPDDATDGPPRDKAGRFAPKTQTSATAQSPDGEDGAPATDDPDAPATDPASPDGAPTATVPAPEVSSGADQPYAFPHRGQAYAIEGAVLRPDGALVVPAAARARVDLLLSRGREHEVYGPQRERQWREEVTNWKSRAEARDAGVDAFTKLLGDNPDPETFLARALEFYESLPALREQQLRDEIERLRGGAKPAAGAAPTDGDQPTPDVLRQQIGGAIEQHLVAFRSQLPEFQGFTDDELRGLHGQLAKRAGLFVRQATAEDEARWGVAPGEIVNDADALLEEAKLLAAPLIQQKRAAAAKAKQETALAEAKKRNAAVLTKPKLEPVPKAGSNGVAGGVPKFKTKDEWDEWNGA